jgi:transcriptional regulator with XRE-family HTH domain
LQSRWPDQEDFARQVGLSLGGYRKYETGERIPSVEVLQRIVERTGVDQKVASELLSQRNDAKALQVGRIAAAEGIITGSIVETADSIEIFARLINTETTSILAAKDVFSQDKSVAQMQFIDSEEGHIWGRMGHDVFKRVRELPQPTIAAVRGLAVGAGCELAASCDLRVASENASLGVPEIKVGSIPGAAAPSACHVSSALAVRK